MQLFATSSNTKLATFACAFNTLRVFLPWDTHALKTGGHITDAARVTPRVHCVAIVCVTPGEGGIMGKNAVHRSPGMVSSGSENRIVDPPNVNIPMDLCAGPQDGVFKACETTATLPDDPRRGVSLHNTRPCPFHMATLDGGQNCSSRK